MQLSTIYIPLWFYSNAVRSADKIPNLLIYIPLWFYSNIASEIASTVPPVFTFHYGSILIKLIPPRYMVSPGFTFHYGSILIFSLLNPSLALIVFTFHYGSILMTIKPPKNFRTKRFTFHYGSILIG